MDTFQFRSLQANKILPTIKTLQRRVKDRFPESGLHRVCGELHSVAEKAQTNTVELAKPNLYLRGSIITLVLAVIVFGINTLVSLDIPNQTFSVTDMLTIIEAGIQDLIFFGAGIFFLMSLEVRLKRRHALDDLNELRALAHVIDMHQLTKEPERVLTRGTDTEFSPKRELTPYELTRYLDYCSEMLSLIGKVAALYVQDFDDQVARAAVNEIETLANGLSRKIWQKIMIIHQLEGRES
ncbi:MAG: hypothetical protein FVQ83_15270 [Chloroflexi bacterium]|nr:hypothetical protein [Chloroflexota bacterium]